MNREYHKESQVLNGHEKHSMQLYRALNRQYSKENAINVVVNFIYKRLGYRTMYLDIVENNKKVMVKDSSCKDINEKSNIVDKRISGVFNLSLSMNEYKKPLCLEDLNSIEEAFPYLYTMIQPHKLLSTPVFAQSKLVGLLIIYDKEKERKISCELKDIAQLVAKELTAVFSRIERQNLAFENMLGLTALENILLYNPEDSLDNTSDPLQKIVSIIPSATGMKKCTIALLDEDEKFLLPHYSTFDKSAKIKEKKYPLDKTKTKDHTAIIAIYTKKPVVVYDALTDPRCDPELSKDLGVRSNIVLPILNVHGKPLGVMYLDNGEYETFSDRQVRFLEIIARHIGLIISNIEYIGDLKAWSKYDGLTGLLNRRTFENIYEEVYKIYRYSEEKFSILMIDIDDFKSTNDNYGHQMGDIVLKNVANCIRENVRQKDIVARYGGEEIIVILKDIGKEEAKIIADRIRHLIETLSVHNISVTVSIGLSTFGIDSYNKENLIHIADKCLYEAKSIGKNQVICK